MPKASTSPPLLPHIPQVSMLASVHTDQQPARLNQGKSHPKLFKLFWPECAQNTCQYFVSTWISQNWTVPSACPNKSKSKMTARRNSLVKESFCPIKVDFNYLETIQVVGKKKKSQNIPLRLCFSLKQPFYEMKWQHWVWFAASMLQGSRSSFIIIYVNWQLRHFKKKKGKLCMILSVDECSEQATKLIVAKVKTSRKKCCHQTSFFLLFINNVSEHVSYLSFTLCCGKDLHLLEAVTCLSSLWSIPKHSSSARVQTYLTKIMAFTEAVSSWRLNSISFHWLEMKLKS